jgi:NhaA family Na+:H+ antiporter
MGRTADRPTWIASDRFLARAVGRPIARFLHVEASGGVLLLLATVVALVWANSPWKAGYEALWTTELVVDLGGHAVTEDLRHWVNDALMAVFFFVVGMEIKRELVDGQLSSARDAALPAVAAVGGMVVPAALYAAINAGGDGAAGWGIPMATDIAFAVGVLALLGDRVPAQLKVLLLALAIVDDIGAIVVIAAFYTDDLEVRWALAALLGLAAVLVLRRARVWYVPAYVLVGAATWLATFESGVHATIAGVVLGLLTPARPLLPEPDADRIAHQLSADHAVTAAELRDVSFQVRESVSVAERLQDLLHPWTSYVVVPVFALANAGVELSGSGLRDAATSPVAVGIVVGLVAGKLAGVAGAVAIARRTGLALPGGVTGRHVGGMAGLAGIGFTVSLFITGLAFDDAAHQAEAKVGILAASVLAAAAGTLVLRGGGRGAIDTPGPPTGVSRSGP